MILERVCVVFEVVWGVVWRSRDGVNVTWLFFY